LRQGGRVVRLVADELLSFSAQLWVVTREVVPTSSTYLAWLSTSCCPPFSPEVLAGSALLQRRLAGRRRWSDRATRACTGGGREGTWLQWVCEARRRRRGKVSPPCRRGHDARSGIKRGYVMACLLTGRGRGKGQRVTHLMTGRDWDMSCHGREKRAWLMGVSCFV
jgi:hypothetical protein